MSNRVFKNAEAKQRLEGWYSRFLEKIPYPLSSEYVSTTYGRSHVLLAGDPKNQPLVCLHSMLTSSAHLLSELGNLPEKYFIIAPDIPGQSVKGLPLHLSYDDHSHSEWLKEILDEMNIDQADIFGVSLGGFIAHQFTSDHSHMVRSLSLMVPAGIVQGNVTKGLMKMAGPFIRYKINPNEETLKKLAGNLLTTWDEDWGNYLGDAFNDFKFHSKIPPLASDEDLQKIDTPCLVIAGKEDISFPGYPLIERVQKHISNVETVLLEDSKHCPPTTNEFRQWLSNKVDGFIKNNTKELNEQI